MPQTFYDNCATSDVILMIDWQPARNELLWLERERPSASGQSVSVRIYSCGCGCGCGWAHRFVGVSAAASSVRAIKFTFTVTFTFTIAFPYTQFHLHFQIASQQPLAFFPGAQKYATIFSALYLSNMAQAKALECNCNCMCMCVLVCWVTLNVSFATRHWSAYICMLMLPVQPPPHLPPFSKPLLCPLLHLSGACACC